MALITLIGAIAINEAARSFGISSRRGGASVSGIGGQLAKRRLVR